MSAAEDRFVMRRECPKCQCPFGRIEEKGFQDVVRCQECDAFNYNAPRRETGKESRSVAKRPGIKPSVRADILIVRAAGKCEICGCSGTDTHPLEVGHLVSVENAERLGIDPSEYNSPENLCAMCPACNSGLGKQTVPARLVVRVLMARIKSGKGIA